MGGATEQPGPQCHPFPDAMHPDPSQPSHRGRHLEESYLDNTITKATASCLHPPPSPKARYHTSTTPTQNPKSLARSAPSSKVLRHARPRILRPRPRTPSATQTIELQKIDQELNSAKLRKEEWMFGTIGLCHKGWMG